jgi:hypothetical protein
MEPKGRGQREEQRGPLVLFSYSLVGHMIMHFNLGGRDPPPPPWGLFPNKHMVNGHAVLPIKSLVFDKMQFTLVEVIEHIFISSTF